MRITKGPVSVQEFIDYVRAVQSCGDHPIPTLDRVIEDGQIDEVLDTYVEVGGAWDDTQGVMLVKLKSGQFGIFSEWADSSGHG